VQEPSATAANRYVAKLVAAQCSLENPPPTCARHHDDHDHTVPATDHHHGTACPDMARRIRWLGVGMVICFFILFLQLNNIRW
jgi:hypothetical protein